jgi:GDP-4-dehydro-6-deoxy-D-mannose reductase
MKIVITGASGFLGSNLVDKLKKNNHNVLPILRDTLNPLQTIFDYKPDIVIHCAWKGGNNYRDVDDISQISNVSDGIELLKVLASLSNKPKFIGFGSFAEYGEISNMAIEDDFEKPTNMYGLSKLTLKNYSEMFCKIHDIPWAWIRPCYVYGPGDVTTRLIPSVITKLIQEETITLDSCDKIIDYIYIDDFINFIYNIIIKSAQGIYNICSGQQYRLRDVIQTIAILLDAEDKIEYKDSELRVLTSQNICGSNLKVKQINSFAPLTTLEEGLKKTIQYHKHKHNNEKRNSN